MGKPLLEVKNLHTSIDTDEGRIKAVNGVSFTLEEGKVLGIVGESGCGKSMMSLSIMGLLDSPAGRATGGEILLDGCDLLKLTEKQMGHIRGHKVSMIFQEPMTSLNPVLTIGDQIVETIRLHQDSSMKESRKRALEMLSLVGIPFPERRMGAYPHQLSGGMRQRVMIAIALSCNPRLLIADEPTTALDVTIQAQILDLMKTLQRELGTSIILITHDLGVVAELADEIAVMYRGIFVETADALTLFSSPSHPYTRGLLSSIPRRGERHKRLSTVRGNVPHPLENLQGCPFHPRCELADLRCRNEVPPFEGRSGRHGIRCFHAFKGGETSCAAKPC